jgi:hypothetical protein
MAVDWAVDWQLTYEERPTILGGYSQGGEAASRFRMEYERGGRLAHLRPNFKAAYIFGNPSRYNGHTYYGGPATPFDGIARWRLPAEVCGDEWCELIEPGDLYGTSARGLTGEIERDVYGLCTDLQIHDSRQFIIDFIANGLAVINNLDGDAGDDLLNGVDRHGVDLSEARLAPPQLIAHLSDKLLSIEGIACAIAAAVDGLIFFCSPPFPTAAHCEYHIREVWPGMTYVGLAIQHVRDWAGR